MSPVPILIGILVTSDRASRGDYADRGGPAIEAWLRAALISPWEPLYRLVPDDRATIGAALHDLADHRNAALILTTGGTGPACAMCRRRSSRVSSPRIAGAASL